MKYEAYQNLIKSRAWSFYKKYYYLVELDELMSEGNFIYLKCLKTYNDNKSKFSTYLTNSLNLYLFNYIKKEKCYNEKIKIEDNLKVLCYDKYNLSDLSSEIKEVLSLIPSDIKQVLINGKLYWNNTKQYITIKLREKNWSYKKIKLTFNSINYMLKEDLI